MTYSCRYYIIILCLSLLLTTFCTATAITQTYGVFDVTFYNIGDSDGENTGQSDWTSQQMDDVAGAIFEWQSQIANVAGRQIQMHLFWGNLNTLGGNMLGNSQSKKIEADGHVWNSVEYAWKAGQNPITSSYGYDTVIQLDSAAAGKSWNFGSDAPIEGEVDFRSIITHEIGHSLGWDSTYDKMFDDWGWMYTTRPYGLYGGLTAWDENLVDSSGNKPITRGKGTPGNFNQTDDPVYFDGENATALYGGLVPITAPATFSYASSLLHLDEATFGDMVMSSSIASGQMARTLSDLEWAMMEDMGWTVVPEPSSVILMISAFGMLRLRSRK
ncbi:MAG: hypothetical protein A2Y12_07090 [Planctomycetes bacterium GWF2_42_9]|nr:MAG: hypothetical protein A2Y12_07090 [Planctomycetes bacterium GWF2_42_9]HAL44938.1 hypothetical protein [Phycisphaerales bacterium]